MPATTPEEVSDLFLRYMRGGDLDALLTVCCNQVEVSAGVQSRSVRLIVLRAGIRGHEAHRLAISLSTSLGLPGGFRPVFW